MNGGIGISTKQFTYMAQMVEERFRKMTSKQSTIDKIKVMQAYVDGEVIEFLHEYYSESIPWAITGDQGQDPDWNWNKTRYRIKPTAIKMTVAELSKQLGYEVEVVAG